LSELEYLGLYGKNSQEIFQNRIISFLRVQGLKVRELKSSSDGRFSINQLSI
jgi:hypothetical protein